MVGSKEPPPWRRARRRFPRRRQDLSQLEKGAPRRRVGLKPEGRAPVREGAALFADAASSEPIGSVTSGGFGPSINAPVAMGYLPTSHATAGELLFAELRGQRLPLRVAACPLFPTPINAELVNAEGLIMTTLYTSDHEWLRIEGDVATIGVTDTRSRSSATWCSSNCRRSAAA